MENRGESRRHKEGGELGVRGVLNLEVHPGLCVSRRQGVPSATHPPSP